MKTFRFLGVPRELEQLPIADGLEQLRLAGDEIELIAAVRETRRVLVDLERTKFGLLRGFSLRNFGDCVAISQVSRQVAAGEDDSRQMSPEAREFYERYELLPESPEREAARRRIAAVRAATIQPVGRRLPNYSIPALILRLASVDLVDALIARRDAIQQMVTMLEAGTSASPAAAAGRGR